MKRTLRRTIFAVVVASGSISANVYAQPNSATGQSFDSEAGRPLITTFGADDNVDGQVWSIVEDDRGIIYAGNNEGVLEYDGIAWRVINLPGGGAVRSLSRDSVGRIWVAAEGNMGFLAPDSVGNTTFLSIQEELPADYRDIHDVKQVWATDEGVYFLTDGAVYRNDKSATNVWPAGEMSFHLSFVVDGEFFVRQWDVGLLRMEHTASGDSLLLVPGGERFATTRIYAMLPFGDGRILVGTREEGLFLFDGQRFEPFETEADRFLEEGGLYLPGTVLPGDEFGLATLSAGLLVINRDGRLTMHLDREAGLPVNTVLCSYPDSAGNLWIGTMTGLARVEVWSPFEQFDDRSGVVGRITNIARHNGRLYASFADTGISVLDPQSGKFMLLEGSQIQPLRMLSIAGDLLVTANTEGVFRIVEGKTEQVRASISGDYNAMILYPWPGDPNRVLVGLQDGLAVLRRDATGWIDEGRIPGVNIDSPGLRSVTEAPDGSVWLATFLGNVIRVHLPFPDENGTLDLEATEVAVLGPEDGLLEGENDVVRLGDKVYVSGSDNRYFDEASGRLILDDEFRQVGSVTQNMDAAGRLWLPIEHNRSPLVRQEDGGFAFEPLPELRRFNLIEKYLEANGIVWFAGTDVLVRFDSRREVAPVTLHPPLIRQVSVGPDKIVYGGMGIHPETAISHGTAALRFVYAAPNATWPVKYRTQLDGFDEEWSPWTEETNRSYTNLPPGDYLFRVEAEGRGETTYALTILPPWYRTWWAYGIYTIFLGLTIFGISRVQRNRLLKKERERNELQHAKLRAEAAERELEQSREIEAAYAQLKSTQAQLIHAEKMASLGKMTAGIAHEIQNPLNFVNNFAEINEGLAQELRSAIENDKNVVDIIDDMEQNARIISRHGRRADGIVRAMMQHASGAATGKHEPTDLNDLVSEQIDLAHTGKLAQNPDLRVIVERDLGKVDLVEIVPQEIGRVLLNLLGNAFDALHEYNPKEAKDFVPVITVSTRQEEDLVEIRIRDNGPGIPADIREKIFEPFFTTKPTGQGTGLGLSLSYDIVTHAHGGSLQVESESNEGATFIVTLPVKKVVSGSSAQDQTSTSD